MNQQSFLYENNDFDGGSLRKKNYSLTVIVSFFLIVMGSIIFYSSTIKESTKFPTQLTCESIELTDKNWKKKL